MSKTYEKGNKPSTAKVSVAGIHRWGMTSYTSLRKARLNGERQKEVAAVEEPAKRVKLEEDPFSFGEVESSEAKPRPTNKPNKFFKSGSRSAPKNSDFDAMRLSVPPSFNSSQDHLFVNIPKPPMFRDLRYAEPAVHYVRPGFDALVNLSAKQDVPSSQDILFGSHELPKDVLFDTASSREVPKDVLFGTTSSREVPKDVLYDRTSPRELPKEVLFDTTASREFQKDDLLSASSQRDTSHELAKKVLFATSSCELPKDVQFNTASSRDVPKEVLLGTFSHKETSRELPKDNLFSQEVPKEGMLDAASQELHKDVLFGATLDTASQEDVLALSQESGKDVLFVSSSSQESQRDTAYSSQELCENVSSKKLSKGSQDSGNFSPLHKDTLFGAQELYSASSQAESEEFLAQMDFPSSQASLDSSGAPKQGSRHKKIFSSSSKFKAVYNHRHWHSSKKTEEVPEDKLGGSLADDFEEEMAKENFRENTNSSSEVTPYKCPKASKEFYTVVKNVKQAYQCHESGETQEFNDDIEYLLECVQEGNAIGTRCLSVLNLAAKCMSPAFRIHLRAHGTMPKIFSALQDAPRDQNLSLCTSALMFVLSQDRLTMDIEASTLSLMLRLLELELPEEQEEELILRDPQLAAMQERHRERVAGLCEEMRLKGHAKHLKMDNINTGILAMETLLSLTSRKAGEWFKEEMRTLRGLDRIADTVTSSTESLLPDEQEVVRRPSEAQLDKIRKIDRCLRVLENVTHMNPENQEYLLTYKDSLLISSCLQLLRLFKTHLLAQPQGEAGGEDVVSCLLNLLKILSNITYGIALDDSMFPQGDGLMDQLLMLILQVPRAVSSEKRFDLLVLSLGLMINLVEYCSGNSAKFVQMHGLGTFDGVNDGYEMLATEALVELMFERLECARLSEEQADELLSTQEAKHAERKDAETAADDLEETLVKTLQKAGKHMEHSIVAAYIVILLGCVSQKHPDFVQVMKDFVPNGNFDVMVDVLKKFKSFVCLTGSIGNRELGSIQKVIQLLESS